MIVGKQEVALYGLAVAKESLDFIGQNSLGQRESNARKCFVVLVATTTAVAISVATTDSRLMVDQLFVCNYQLEVAAIVRKASMLVSFR